MAGVLSECIAESARTWKETGYPLIVIGTVTEPSEVDTNLTSPFKHDFKVEVCSCGTGPFTSYLIMQAGSK